MNRILITGWTGNTGTRVVERAAQHWPGAAFVGLTRQPRARPPAGLEDRFRVAVADLGDPAAVESEAFCRETEPYDLMLHVAHIQHTPVMMRLAALHGVRRAVLVHTTGMYSRHREYGGRYREIDAAVVALPADALPAWTILRPTMIYGNADPRRRSGRDHNLHRVICALARWPVFPVIGADALFQPVHVDDVAAAVIDAVAAPCRGCDFDVSGGTVASYRDILLTIADLLGRRVPLVPISLDVAEALTTAGQRYLNGRAPITLEQVRRLREDKVFDHSAATLAFGFRPRDLRQGLSEEIAQLRGIGLLPGAPRARPTTPRDLCAGAGSPGGTEPR